MVLRFIRTAVTFTAVAADFKWTWYNNPEGSPTYKTATAELHQRTADRLLQLAHANRGLYIKSGQYLTSMSHALPAAYITTLKPLLNEAPSMPFEDVQRLLSQEFPSTPFSSLFATFSPIPVAAASIAQVHSATLPDGTRVAVKLQYPTLDKQFHSDLLAHRLTLMATEFFFPRFHLSWMHTELAANLVQELDFVHEARNSERGARKFAETGNATVKVPRVYWTHTRRRVLTMEWVDGVKVNDKAGLEKLGVKAGDAARCAIEAMSEQIFLHGFVHCDPHGGNLFVRRKPEGSASKEPFELVILDWGLCRQMRESVRIQYCKVASPCHQPASPAARQARALTHTLSSVLCGVGVVQLWTALIMRKDDDVRSAVKGLGVQGESEDDDVWELIAMSILMRPYKASSMGFSNKMSAQDMATLRQTLAHKMDKWVDAFQLMPRELLLVLRNQSHTHTSHSPAHTSHTTRQPFPPSPSHPSPSPPPPPLPPPPACRPSDYLRALNYEMGQPCNRFRVMARMALKGREWRTDAAEVAQNRIEFGDSWNELRGEQRIQEEVEARRGRLQRWWERASFELNLVYADVTRWLGMLLFQWYADPSLQQEMEQMAKRTGEEGNPLFGG